MRWVVLVLLALSACVPKPRAGPFRPYTCDVPYPEWRAECPVGAHLHVILSDDERMREIVARYHPQYTSAYGATWKRGRSYYVEINTAFPRDVQLRALQHEVRCHVAAFEAGDPYGNVDHYPMPGWDCEITR